MAKRSRLSDGLIRDMLENSDESLIETDEEDLFGDSDAYSLIHLIIRVTLKLSVQMWMKIYQTMKFNKHS